MVPKLLFSSYSPAKRALSHASARKTRTQNLVFILLAFPLFIGFGLAPFIKSTAIYADTLSPTADDNAPLPPTRNCTQADRDYAAFWKNYYDPEEAYKFGVEIQKQLAQKDMEGFFALVDGELKNGPRRAFALSRPFDKIFDDKWVEAVLSSQAPCSPVGWRGFMLANGRVWYNYAEQWHIVGINGIKQEAIRVEPWRVKGGLLGIGCFAYEWISSDNFQTYEEQFHITDYPRFANFTGEFFGREITDYAPIKPSWYSKKGDEISLINSVTSCAVKDSEVSIKNNVVTGFQIQEDYENHPLEEAYEVLARFSPQACSALAPNIGSRCLESRAIWVGRDTGGTIGWDSAYGIYGLFELDGIGLSVVPLRYFGNRNEMLNFILGE